MRLFYLLRLANLIVGDKNQKYLSDQTTFQTLMNVKKEMGGHIFTNIYVPLKGDNMTLLNFIYITKYGIFVIETKNIGGKILGKDDSEYWELHLPGDANAYQVNNAYKVNETNVRVAERLLGIEDEIVNMVCFIKADIRSLESKHSYYPFYLAKEILSYKKGDPIYTDEEIEDYYLKLKYVQEHPILTYDDFLGLVGNLDVAPNHFNKNKYN